jgi:hypothetical protein
MNERLGKEDKNNEPCQVETELDKRPPSRGWAMNIELAEMLPPRNRGKYKVASHDRHYEANLGNDKPPQLVGREAGGGAVFQNCNQSNGRKQECGRERHEQLRLLNVSLNCLFSSLPQASRFMASFAAQQQHRMEGCYRTQPKNRV